MTSGHGTMADIIGADRLPIEPAWPGWAPSSRAPVALSRDGARSGARRPRHPDGRLLDAPGAEVV